ncbi:MAG: SET domain-containing protein-lysine N-methyltransferase [Chloracidobacterium sp.]|nr:SET domain-containing protein-lysine N-methyltransferase [Chloracidobacterium sp.]
MRKSRTQQINLAPGIEIRPSKIDGRGCFATIAFKKGRKIAEYEGERISRHEVARRLKNKRRLYICGVDFYWAIDGSSGGNGTQFINHSCEPNCYSKVIHGHILFFALRDIEAGEELLLDYGESYHSNRKRCLCGAPSCRGRINA